MELTRRDAVAALAAVGVGTGGLAVARRRGLFGESSSVPDGVAADDEIAEDPIPHLTVLAEVLYPSDVTVTDEFLETYVVGRVEDDDTYLEAMVDGLSVLETEAAEHGADGFRDLSVDERDALLRNLGLHETPADPDGEAIERVRYYLVDELLYALFTTPAGGELVGTENPAGYPGGIQTYRRGEAE